MTLLHVSAGRTLLESYVKTPGVGLCELIWNAFDADATTVSVGIETNGLGGLEQVHVSDDGSGMTLQRAERAFATVGDSWKLMPGTLSEGGRVVHGRYGRGRYAAFALGNSVTWISVAMSLVNGLETLQIRGDRSNLDSCDVETISNEGSVTGTRVLIGGVTPEAIAAFDEREGIRLRLLTEFALHLERHKDFSIEFLGTKIEPSQVVESRATFDLDLPEDVAGTATLIVIHWNLEGVERRLYLCSADGAIREELQAGVQAPGAEFTAFVMWKGFSDGPTLVLDGADDTPAGKVVAAARDALRAHLAESSRKREAETVRRWQAEGVYPYKGEPATPVEHATRDTFNLVAMAASRTVNESRSQRSKALSLSLLKETFENDPESLLPILREFSVLPAARIEELRQILERTTLAQLIALGRAVGNRIDFLNGLNALLFDKTTKRALLERRQLHRVLAHETWIFGEEWSLTGDDQRLTEVLKTFLALLGVKAELAGSEPVLREDGTDAIPDLVLGRRLETAANQFAHLVVELKRPAHKLTDDDVTQLRSYASAITNDERFAQPNVTWDFWLVGNDTTRSVDEARTQQHHPFGVVQESKKYRIVVKTWAEVIGDADHRLKFVEASLQYESSRDTGLAHLRQEYAEYLPLAAIPPTRASDASAQEENAG